MAVTIDGIDPTKERFEPDPSLVEHVTIAEGGSGARMPNVAQLAVRDRDSDELIPFVPLKTRQVRVKYVSKNGTYHAEEDGVYAWDKVVVGIPMGEQGESVPTKLVDGRNVAIPKTIIDENGNEVPNPEYVERAFTLPAGIGHSVEGYDPAQGGRYKVEVVAGVPIDPMTEQPMENGPVLSYMLPPASIKITKVPNEPDFSDIVVTAYTSVGSVWRSSKYPDGVIPFAELQFSNIQTVTTRGRFFNSNNIKIKRLGPQESCHVGEPDTASDNPADYIPAEPLIYAPLMDWRTYPDMYSGDYHEKYRSLYADSSKWVYVNGMKVGNGFEAYAAAFAYPKISYSDSRGRYGYVFIDYFIITTIRLDELPENMPVDISRAMYPISTGNYDYTVVRTASRPGLIYSKVDDYSIAGKYIAVLYHEAEAFRVFSRIRENFEVNDIRNIVMDVTATQGDSFATCDENLGKYRDGTAYNFPLNIIDRKLGDDVASSSNPVMLMYNAIYGGPVEYKSFDVSWLADVTSERLTTSGSGAWRRTSD